MKMTTLEKVYETLLNEENEVVVDEEIALKARAALNKMMDLS